jgi:hypothetical protein
MLTQTHNLRCSCLYWNDDGQPAGSTLSLGTTGDSTQDLTRAAVYGNASSDDCPSWSDYTCSLSGSTLTAIYRRASAATHVKVKMPKHIPGTRGSKYVHSTYCSLCVNYNRAFLHFPSVSFADSALLLLLPQLVNTRCHERIDHHVFPHFTQSFYSAINLIVSRCILLFLFSVLGSRCFVLLAFCFDGRKF